MTDFEKVDQAPNSCTLTTLCAVKPVQRCGDDRNKEEKKEKEQIEEDDAGTIELKKYDCKLHNVPITFVQGMDEVYSKYIVYDAHTGQRLDKSSKLFANGQKSPAWLNMHQILPIRRNLKDSSTSLSSMSSSSSDDDAGDKDDCDNRIDDNRSNCSSLTEVSDLEEENEEKEPRTIIYRGITMDGKQPVIIKKSVVLYEDTDTTYVPEINATIPHELNVLCKAQKIDGVIPLIEAFAVAETGTKCGAFLIMPDFGENLYQCGLRTQKEIRNVIRHILNTLINLRRAGIHYLDIKEENVVIDRNTRSLAIIDFESCAVGGPKQRCGRVVWGSPGTLPPEYYQYNDNEDERADMSCFILQTHMAYQLGCVMFNMIFRQLLPVVRWRCGLKITPGTLGKFACQEDADAADLINQCIAFSPRHRPTLTDIAKHRWFHTDYPDQLHQCATSAYTAVKVQPNNDLLLQDGAITPYYPEIKMKQYKVKDILKYYELGAFSTYHRKRLAEELSEWNSTPVI